MTLLQNPRELRGLGILSHEGAVVKVSESAYSVKSQTNGGRYAVSFSKMAQNWFCECPDFTGRKVNCKHIFAVLFSRKLAAQVEWDAEREVPPPPNPSPTVKPAGCPFCGASGVRQDGVRRTGRGPVQRFECGGCGRKFTPDQAFSKMKTDPKAVTLAMDLWFKGMSIRKIQDTLKQFYGVEVASTATPLRWIRKYSALLASYADQHKAEAGDFWHSDEMTVNIRGEGGRKALEWIWNLMDSKTRFLLACRITKTRFTEDAQAVIEEAQGRAAKPRPLAFITDGLQSYRDAAMNTLYDVSAPIRNPHLRIPPMRVGPDDVHPSNSILERLNGSARERLKVMRGFGTEEGAKAAMDGWRFFYNYVRPHMGLGGMTPAQAAGLPVPTEGNRWLALIEAAASPAGKRGVEKGANPP